MVPRPRDASRSGARSRQKRGGDEYMIRRPWAFYSVCTGIVITGALFARTQANHHTRAVNHFMQADTLQREGRLEEAIAEMRLALDEQPRYFEARRGLSDMYLSDGRVAQGVQVFSKRK